MFEICYTSGTTGLPKGAMLTNKNIVCLSQAASEFFVSDISTDHWEFVVGFSDRFSLSWKHWFHIYH